RRTCREHWTWTHCTPGRRMIEQPTTSEHSAQKNFRSQCRAMPMKPTVYIETTVPSLLTSRPSRDVETAAQQIATREWWEKHRGDFELYVSADVLDEAERGDVEAARLRLATLAECKVLAATAEAQLLTKRILSTGL